jgi:Questin oxidase-like
MGGPLYTTLDDALDAISPYGIELTNGNSNHAPMVAEALCAMGRPEAVMPWIARYRERMSPRAPARDRVRQDEWRTALGWRERFADWSAFFRDKLEEAPWHDVLDRWVGNLASGFCGAATHGVIRVGHAVRGLSAGETPSRMRELADALAGWAATWQELPRGDPGANGSMTPREAIVHVPIVPPDKRLTGNIVAALGALDSFAEFAPVIGLLDTGGEIPTLVVELTDVFARVYLANARNIPTVIAFIHGVTSHAALGNIASHVSDASARLALRYAWQTGCALYACYGGGTPMADNLEPSDETEEALVDRAVANGDEHVIKFTEACLSRYALDRSPAYFAAAGRVTEIIRRR